MVNHEPPYDSLIVYLDGGSAWYASHSDDPLEPLQALVNYASELGVDVMLFTIPYSLRSEFYEGSHRREA
jgi:hypothetical protein